MTEDMHAHDFKSIDSSQKHLETSIWNLCQVYLA